MKRLIFLILLLPLSISAQYAVADFFVINEGKEKDYEKLEMAWSIFRQNQIDKGQKMNWAVWKIDPRKDERANAADYVVAITKALLRNDKEGHYNKMNSCMMHLQERDTQLALTTHLI